MSIFDVAGTFFVCYKIAFSSLKYQLIDLYAQKKSTKTENKFAIGQLLNRKQNEYELVSDFGYDMINIAKMVMPNVSIEQIDDMLKEQFINGIYSERLREKVKMKRNKVVEILRNKISIEELINYAQVAEKSMESNKPKQRTIRWKDEIPETSSHSSDESGIEPQYINQAPQDVNICMLHTTPTQKIEGKPNSPKTVQAQDTQTISSKRFESNSESKTSQNSVAKSNRPYAIENQPILEEKTTQTTKSYDSPVTAENILQKRAEIRDYYEKERSQIGQQNSMKFDQRNQSRKFQNPKTCHFCGKKGHEMKVCHGYNKQKADQAVPYQSQYPAQYQNQQQYHIPQQHLSQPYTNDPNNFMLYAHEQQMFQSPNNNVRSQDARVENQPSSNMNQNIGQQQQDQRGRPSTNTNQC